MNALYLLLAFYPAMAVINRTLEPRSGIVASLLRSNSVTYPRKLTQFKGRLINCKIHQQFMKGTLNQACRDIIYDFRVIFHNNYEQLEHRCRRSTHHNFVPCFSQYHWKCLPWIDGILGNGNSKMLIHFCLYGFVCDETINVVKYFCLPRLQFLD